MRHKLLIVLLAAALIMPLSASAFWFWDKPAEKAASPAAPTAELDQTAQDALTARYKLWSASFEKQDADAVLANRESFWFSVPELNYLFARETAKQKRPVLTDFKMTADGDVLDISANFRQIVPGRFSFTARVVDEGGRAHLSLSKVKLYGWTIPASWFNKPLNRALDDYFSFLYKDDRYDGFSFSATDGILKLTPNFK